MSYQKQTALPLPEQAAVKRSHALVAEIHAALKIKGSMTFAEYMAMVLYHPQYGYYTSHTPKFGEQGDFITAPEFSPLFSQCLAMQCRQVLRTIKHGAILEIGAGSGIMAAEILSSLNTMQCVPTQYYIYEISEALRRQQQQTIEMRCPKLYTRVHWLSDLLEVKLQGVILANEWLDAMPIERFKIAENDVLQAFIVSVNDAFQLDWQPTNNPILKTSVQQLQSQYQLQPGYQSEINLGFNDGCKTLSTCLERGAAFFIDYGYAQKEYYHPQRTEGTFKCFYQHRAHEDPFWYPGSQDLTAHVDFTALAIAANEAGFEMEGFTSQAHFLMNCGLTSLNAVMSDESADPISQFQFAQQVKHLILPSEMGELFKVLAMTKAYEESLLGFQLYNLLERL